MGGPKRALAKILRGGSVALLLGGAVRGQDVDEKAEAKLLFETLDRNSDGKVEREEYLAATHADLEELEVGAEEAEDLLDTYDKLFLHCDIDEDGDLNEAEVEYAYHLAREQVREAMRKARLEYQMAMLEAMRAAQEERASEGSGAEEAGEDAEAAEPAGEDGEEAAESAADTSKQDETSLTGKDSDEDADVYGQQQLLRVFESADLNKDGVVDIDEFNKLLNSNLDTYGWKLYSDDPEILQWAEEIFKRADVVADGGLSQKEMHLAAFLIDRDITAHMFLDRTLASSIFEDLDHDGDGKIQEAEVVTLMEQEAQELAAKAAEVPEEEMEEEEDVQPTLLQVIHSLFTKFDEDSDGALDKDEALKLASAAIGEL